MDYEIDFLKALLSTISVETIVLIVLAKTLYRNDELQLKLLILTGFIASMATLPYLWFIFPLFLESKLWYKLISELTAIIVETFIIFGLLRISLKKSFTISVICNLISYLSGLIIPL